MTLPARGLVLGKFLPPHRGHLRLIEAARAGCRKLTIVVGSLDREPIPGERRFEWMQELCPRDRVVHLTEALPQEPPEHPQFWELWTAALRRCCPEGVDVVFSSEEYGEELARRLGASHQCIDRSRATVPISGTAIRNDPMKHWEFIPGCVRPWFARKVVVYGAESTGKTTLARDLAARLNTVWVPEYARIHLESLGRWVVASDIPHIAAGQIATENEASRRANRVVICDTDLNTTAVYSTLFFGSCPDWIEHASRHRPANLYLVCDTDLPWVADPLRDQPHRREFLHRWFVSRLEEQGRTWRWVRGSGEARVDAAQRAVQEMLGRRTGADARAVGR